MTRQIEWLNSNSYRYYPFVDDSNMSFSPHTLPNDAVLDATLVGYTPGQDEFRLARVEVSAGDIATFVFEYGDTEIPIELPPDPAYPYTPNVLLPEVRCTITFGPGCAEVSAWGEGVYTAATPPEVWPSRVLVHDKHRVDTVGAIDQPALSGQIRLVPGTNCRPTVLPSGIRFVAGVGFGAGINCEPPEGGVSSCDAAFLWLNGQPGSSDGHAKILGRKGVTVESDPATHVIKIRVSQSTPDLLCG